MNARTNFIYIHNLYGENVNKNTQNYAAVCILRVFVRMSSGAWSATHFTLLEIPWGDRVLTHHTLTTTITTTMIAATSSFDFQRESHFYLLLSVVCTAHGTNITQNECAFHLFPMWILHITLPSAHNQKWNRDWDTNWANKCK